MNNVALVGRTTRDLNLKYTQSKKAVAQFTLAVDRRGRNEMADFILCEVWGRTAEVMERFVKKGHKIGITGRIRSDSYDDRNGKRQYVTKVVVEDLEFLEHKKDQSNDFVSVDDVPF